MKSRLIIIIAAVLVIGGLIALFIFGSQTTETQLSGTLSFWGTYDDAAVMYPLFDGYKALHPKAKIEINYTQVDPGTYETRLVDALAGATPPDIFMFHNTWLPKHVNKILPLSNDAVSLANFNNLFPTVVQQDFAPDGVIYALPLYVDTLALYYNQDIFDNKGLSFAPKTWTDFEKIVPRIREIDKAGRITKSAGAVGGSNKSINRGTDILNLMMLQAGTKMVADDFSVASFDSQEGQNALAYYTKFANARDASYTWNDSLPYSLDAFAGGEAAMMFNYSHQMTFLKDKNPFLKFRVAPMLQPLGAAADINFANYWGVAISNKTLNRTLAQDFLLYLTTDPTVSQQYLTATGRPPALRALIDQYMATKPELGIFAKQALTARSWPEIDNIAVDSVLSGLVSDVISGKTEIRKGISEAASTITGLMQARAK